MSCCGRWLVPRSLTHSLTVVAVAVVVIIIVIVVVVVVVCGLFVRSWRRVTVVVVLLMARCRCLGGVVATCQRALRNLCVFVCLCVCVFISA